MVCGWRSRSSSKMKFQNFCLLCFVVPFLYLFSVFLHDFSSTSLKAVIFIGNKPYYSTNQCTFRENSSMSSQLVLNLDTSDSGIYHNGESVCIALCDMAKHFADQVSKLWAVLVLTSSQILLSWYQNPSPWTYSTVTLVTVNYAMLSSLMHQKQWNDNIIVVIIPAFTDYTVLSLYKTTSLIRPVFVLVTALLLDHYYPLI